MRALIIGSLVVVMSLHGISQHQVSKMAERPVVKGIVSVGSTLVALVLITKCSNYYWHHRLYKRGLAVAYSFEQHNLYTMLKEKYFNNITNLIRCEQRDIGLFISCKSEFTDDEARIRWLADDIAAFNYYQRHHKQPIWRFKYEQGTGIHGHYNQLWFLIPSER